MPGVLVLFAVFMRLCRWDHLRNSSDHLRMGFKRGEVTSSRQRMDGLGCRSQKLAQDLDRATKRCLCLGLVNPSG